MLTGNWGNDLTLLVKACREVGLNAKFFTFYGNALGAPAVPAWRTTRRFGLRLSHGAALRGGRGRVADLLQDDAGRLKTPHGTLGL